MRPPARSTVLGQSLRKLRGRKLVRFRGQYIGFVFQQYNLLPALTAAGERGRAAAHRRPQTKRGRRQGQRHPRIGGHGEKINSLPSQLSGGQQQRVAIARALVHEPKLLVCDEPTAALDAHSGQVVLELLKRVAVQPDRAVIVVTHDNRIFRFGDRIVQMSDGIIEKVERKS